MTSDSKTVNGVSTEEQIPFDAPSYAGSKERNAESPCLEDDKCSTVHLFQFEKLN
jgi:hypothetical protein